MGKGGRKSDLKENLKLSHGGPYQNAFKQPVALAAVRSKAKVILLLIHCFRLLGPYY